MKFLLSFPVFPEGFFIVVHTVGPGFMETSRAFFEASTIQKEAIATLTLCNVFVGALLAIRVPATG